MAVSMAERRSTTAPGPRRGWMTAARINSAHSWSSLLVVVLALLMVALTSCSSDEGYDDSLGSLPRATKADEPPLPRMGSPPPGDLVMRDLKEGSGARVEGKRLLVINFVLTEWGSTTSPLDSTSRRGLARVWPYGVGKLIPGVEEGLNGMREGGRRLIVVPPALGYGDEPLPGTTGNLPLVFVVDLIKVGLPPSEER